MAKIKESTIDKLIPDDRNNNKGTEFGNHLIEKSLRKLGAGRSIVLDKNNRIICGNKTIEGAASIGIENIIIVETTGNEIVCVKRMDIDLDSSKGRELALADNATAKANIKWDEDVIKEISAEFDIVPKDWGIDIELEEITEPTFDGTAKPMKLIVECKNQEESDHLLDELTGRGYKCFFAD